MLGDDDIKDAVARAARCWDYVGKQRALCPGVDTARRTLHIRFESLEENPEKRQAFRHPDLLDWVRASRGRLAAAALTILSMYVKEGAADQLALKTWGAFEAWSRLIRSRPSGGAGCCWRPSAAAGSPRSRACAGNT